MDLKCIRNNNAQLYLERICNLKNISRLVILKKKLKLIFVQPNCLVLFNLLRYKMYYLYLINYNSPLKIGN